MVLLFHYRYGKSLCGSLTPFFGGRRLLRVVVLEQWMEWKSISIDLVD